MNDRIKMMLVAACLVFVVGLLARIKKIQLSAKASLVVKKVFIFMCFLLFIVFVLSLFGIYFRGYWTTKAIVWAFLLTASLYYSFGNKQILTKPWKNIATIVFYFPIASALLMVIPTFLGTIVSYSLWLRLTGDPGAIYYNDSEIRIQRVCAHCDAGFQGFPRYFKKEGLFELDKGELDNGNNLFDDRIKVEKTKDSIIVYLYYANSVSVPFKFKR